MTKENTQFPSIELKVAGPESEFSTVFLQGMLNRMAVSYHKYGPVSDGYPQKISAIESLLMRLQKYQETSNTEYLIDAANFAMIEFMHPSVKGAYFSGTDSDASPGRVAADGQITANTNNDL